MKPQQKWWGWGDPNKKYDLQQHPNFISYLKELLDFSDEKVLPPPKIEDIKIPKTKLTKNHISSLRKILDDNRVRYSDEERITHTYGSSFKDLIRIRLKSFKNVPDAVLYPENEEEILKILKWASRQNVAVVPRGGGTSVVGGVETVHSSKHSAVVILDLQLLNKVLRIEKHSLVADVGAGIYGPHLEETLQNEGVTLSHYPESFEYSTLGGWIAARSAGQQSTLYGKIEEMVESVRVATPDGIIETLDVPAAANGPDFNRLFIGSEGIFGIITRARIKLQSIPEEKYYTAYLFKSYDDGINACREILQSGFKPAAIRLSDADETNFIFSLLEPKTSAVKDFIQNTGIRWIEKRGYIRGKRAFLLIGLEGTSARIRYEKKHIHKIIRSRGGFHLGRSAGEQWYRQRFDNPYRRDALLDYGLIVDTLETATEWDNVPNFHRAVIDAIKNSFEQAGIKGIAMAHLSHMYPTGSSIYYIILASPHRGKELDEWEIIKNAATNAIVRNGGTISHHHGVGLDHKKWLENEIGEKGIQLLRSMKKNLDPKNILNPGKVI